MKKIKQLLKNFEYWLLSKQWLYEKAKRLHAYIFRAVQAQDKRYYTAAIAKATESLKYKTAVRTVATTALDTVLQSRQAGMNSPLPLDMFIRLVISTTDIVCNSLQHIVGIQPLSAPVGLVFKMVYKNKEDAKIVTGEDLSKSSRELGNAITLEIVSSALAVASRKSASGFTVDAAQDLHMHGLDIESELIKALSDEIASDIITGVLNNLVEAAPKALPSNPYGASGRRGADVPDFIGDRFAIAGLRINVEANEIARKTMRGPGNFIVCSPLVLSILQSSSKSNFVAAEKTNQRFTYALKPAGTLNGTIKVYTTLWFGSDDAENRILIGYKGGVGECDTGYIYSPYNIMSSGVVANPKTFSPEINFIVRDGHDLFNPNYYSVLELGDLTIV